MTGGAATSGDNPQSKASLASQAHAAFSIGKYEKALEHLTQISAQLGDKEDSRLQFNLLLSEAGRAGFKDPKALRESFAAIRNSLKERSVRVGSRSKDSLRLEDDLDLDTDDTDTDTSILLYNLAALHFHEKQYGAARKILHSLFARIEVLEEVVGVHVCFLLLDVLLHSARGNVHTEKDRERYLQQTTALLSYLERPHNFSGPLGSEGDSGSGDKKEEGASDGLGGEKGGGAALGGKEGRNLEMIEFNFRVHLYKAKARLLQGQAKASKKEIKSALEIFTRELRPNNDSGGTKGGADSDDEETAVTLSASGPQGAQAGGDPSLPPPYVANVAALYLKANLEYVRQNYRKALKLLASCQKGEGGGRSPFYYSNLGCVHAKMGLYHVSLQDFQRALQCDDASASEGGLNRGLESDGRVLPPVLCEVMYNTGLQLLLLGRYTQAFRCFENSALLYYNRPRVWLRMAECCIQQYKHDQEVRDSKVKGRILMKVIGKGRHRRAVLDTSRFDPSTPAPPPKGEQVDGDSSVNGTLRGQCTLPYAVKCLQNALFLLSIASQGGGGARLPVGSLLGPKALKDKEGAGGAGGSAEAETEVVTDNGAESQPEQDDALLEQIALLQLSYVYLCLREPLLALHHAEQLLKKPNVTEPRVATARQYAAEALCVLNRPEDALRLLLGPNGQTPVSDEAAAAAVAGQRQRKGKEVTPSSFIPQEHFAAQARSGLQLNLANVYLMMGDVALAERHVRNGLTMCPSSTEALRALVFVLLRKGSTAQAVEVLRTRRPVGEG